MLLDTHALLWFLEDDPRLPSSLILNPTWLPPKWFRANAIRPYGLAFL